MRFQEPFGVVTPSLDGEILNVLARAEAWFTAPQLTHRLENRSVEGVRRALARLVGEGVVERESTARTPLYRLNRQHLAAPAILAIAGQRDELLTRIRDAVGEWPHPPRYAAIFGSAVHGRMRVDSDIDLFLVRPADADERWADEVAALAAAAARWTGNDVRPLEYGERELTAAGDEPVLRDIAGEGITVFGDRAWFRQQVGVR